MPDWSRRSFLIRSGGVGVGAVAAGVIGRNLLESGRTAPVGDGPAVPPASVTVPPLRPEADLSATIAGLTPLVVPTDQFYRIDTALLTPNVSTVGWTLRIHGLVDRETILTWEQLIALPMFEQYVTIACVSNEVGGNLVGNAKWTGVRLRDVLDIAGVQTAATQLVGRSADGWTAGMPTAWVMDPAREPMIAFKMNDEPLPRIHGYPARLIIPGLFGYVSATKWLTELELTTLEAFNGYWIPLGWAKDGPILTQSRIDTPRGGVARGAGGDRGDRLGPGSRHLQGRSRHRWCLARCPPVGADLGRDLGPVGHRLGGRSRTSRDHGPRDRRDRRGPGGAALAAGAGWCARLAHDLGQRRLTRPELSFSAGATSSDMRRSPCAIASSIDIPAAESSLPRSRYSARSWTSRSKNRRRSYFVITFPDLLSRSTAVGSGR